MRTWLVRLQNAMAADLIDYSVSPSARQRAATSSCRLDRGEVSSERKHFITDKVKANTTRLGQVKVKSFNSFFDIGAQFVPSITLAEDAFAQAFGRKPAVGVLRYLEHQFVHLLECRLSHRIERGPSEQPYPRFGL